MPEDRFEINPEAGETILRCAHPEEKMMLFILSMQEDGTHGGIEFTAPDGTKGVARYAACCERCADDPMHKIAHAGTWKAGEHEIKRMVVN